jgi:hypothetical protein
MAAVSHGRKAAVQTSLAAYVSPRRLCPKVSGAAVRPAGLRDVDRSHWRESARSIRNHRERLMEIVMVFYSLGVVLAIVLIIAWTILPFAIIGTKPLLRKLLAEVQATNALLERQMKMEILSGERRSLPG